MPIRSKITKKEYASLFLFLMYKNTAVKIFIGICLLGFVAVGILLYKVGTKKPDVFDLWKPLFFLGFLYFFFWNTARKAYDSNKRLGETIEYRFDEDHLIVTGESFSAELTWAKIHKVAQTEKWILIYQTRNAANFIAKKIFRKMIL